MAEASLKRLKDPRWWRQEFNNLFFFCKVGLSTAWPDKFHDFSSLQEQMCNFLTPGLNLAKKKLISVYRGSLKTTVLQGFVCWLICWYHHKKEPTSIIYNTATEKNAMAFMEDVRYTLLNCGLIQAAFGLPSKKENYDSWTKNSIKIGHVKFSVSSFEEQQASRHARIIINDDLVNEKNWWTEASRDEVHRKWKFQKSVVTQITGNEMSLEIDVGTPYHSKDLMWWLMRKNTTYDKFIVACVSGWPNATISDIINRTRPLSNPELMTYELLLEKVQEQGNAIASSQYCLRPLAEEDAFCQESWLRYWKKLPEISWRTFVIDPGGAIPGFHDATGFTILDCDPEGLLYVVYADEYWLTPRELIEKIQSLMEQYKPDDVRVEKDKYSMTIADTLERDLTKCRVSFIEHKHRHKQDRIWRLRNYFAKGKILVNENQAVLIDQILQYQPPQETRDDILDSLSYHLDIIRIPKNIERPRFEPVIENSFIKEFDEYMEGIKAKQNGGIDYESSY